MRTHTVACLAGDGLGPELMAEATRTLRKVARMHGFAVEEVHAPFGSEALTRSGHPLPPATRSAVLAADAVLVAAAGPSLGDVESELDLRAGVTNVLWRRGGFMLVSPEAGEPAGWAVERALDLAERRRGRLVAVDHDATWAALVDEAADRRHTVTVEHLSLAETLHTLAFRPEQLDVVASAGPVTPALEELAAGGDGSRLVARCRLAGNGPSVFAPGQTESHDDAGHGVADPGAMLLAASLMLGEGLGERHAADTLAAALGAARAARPGPAAAVRRTLSASTRDLSDTVVRLLPASHRGAEFLNEATG